MLPGPRSTRLLGWAISWAVRALVATWRVRRSGAHLLAEARASGPVVLALFHEDTLPVVGLHRDLGIAGMVSRSADGSLLAEVLDRLGYGVLRGSTSRGGRGAALGAARRLAAAEGSVALAVDGPRGPRRVAQAGAIRLAAAARRPIVLLGVQARPQLRLGTWDRFRIPLPFARVEVRYGRLDLPEDRGGDAAPLAALEQRLAALSAV